MGKKKKKSLPSSSSGKRQRLTSIPENEEEAEPVQNAEDEEEEGANVNVVVSEARSVKFSNLDVLDCPVCCNPLKVPIFQCDNSHVACSSCCTNLRNKCPFCTLPTGNIRVKCLEAVVESVIVPCPNAKHGCTEEFSYGKELDHERECRFELCYCPAPDCDYAGVYKDLYSHYSAKHKAEWNGYDPTRLSHTQWVSYDVRDYVIQENKDDALIAVQFFKVSDGLHVTVNCIAPSAPGVGEFAYNISYSKRSHSTVFDPLEKMIKIQRTRSHTPEKGKHVMEIPHSFLTCPDPLKMHVSIRRLVEEEQEEAASEGEEEVDN